MVLAHSCAYLATHISLIFGSDALLTHLSVLDKACARLAADPDPDTAGGVARGATATAKIVRELCEAMTPATMPKPLGGTVGQIAETGWATCRHLRHCAQ